MVHAALPGLLYCYRLKTVKTGVAYDQIVDDQARRSAEVGGCKKFFLLTEAIKEKERGRYVGRGARGREEGSRGGAPRAERRKQGPTRRETRTNQRRAQSQERRHQMGRREAERGSHRRQIAWNRFSQTRTKRQKPHGVTKERGHNATEQSHVKETSRGGA